ncbi:hypothetical protein [Paenibacillus terrigena]|uniref:hypothetical protein n=1 Tax=Paenibacillus terrigena TaxID=369333 RepID=UPI000366BFBC|nr:hypothetical protein [Paenibacillus terrigena]
MAKLNGVFVSEDGSKILVGGVEYALTGDDAKAGDIVKVTDIVVPSYVESGAFYLVDELDSCDDPQITDEDGDEYDLSGDEYKVYTKVIVESGDIVTVDGMKYRKVDRPHKVGDYVLMLTDDEDLEKGQVYEIAQIDSDGDGVFEDEAGDDRYFTTNNSQRQLVELVAESTPAPKVERFKVGEYARVLTDNQDLDVGSIVKITRDDEDGRPFRCELLDGSNFDFYRQDELERIPSEELQFAKFGRKLNEFKVGDFVKFNEHDSINGLNEYDGIFTKIDKITGDLALLVKPQFVMSDYGTYTSFKHIELIAPVESLQIAS